MIDISIVNVDRGKKEQNKLIYEIKQAFFYIQNFI